VVQRIAGRLGRVREGIEIPLGTFLVTFFVTKKFGGFILAGIGLKSFKYAKLNDDGKTYGSVKTLSGAIECKVTLDLAEATLYCDDALKEQVSMFKSGTLTAGIDEDDDAIFAELLGKTVDDETGVVVSNVSDEPIYVGFGHIVPKMVNGAKKYKVEFFPKMKFNPFIADAKTKGDNLEFTTPSVEATIFENNDGDWEKHKVYDTESEANSALDGFFVQAEVTGE
jgi:phi13 family phage major tail protein